MEPNPESLTSRGLRLAAGLASRFRNLWLRFLGVRTEGYVWIRKVQIARHHHEIFLGSGAALDHGVNLRVTVDCEKPAAEAARLHIGAGVYINCYTTIDAHRDLRIEDGVMIGPFCYLTDADHDHRGMTPVRESEMRASFLRIGKGAWLGAHVVVLPGVTIGENAIIGAGSVVTSDIPSNTVAYGSPARVQRQRSESK